MFEQDHADGALAALNEDCRQNLVNQLNEHEQVFWCGQPDPRRLMLSSIILAPFGLFFGSIPLFAFLLNSSLPLGMRLFFLPFVLIGAALATSPLWVRRSAGRTIYAVTNERALIVKASAWGSVKVRSFRDDLLDDMEVTRRANGGGDIIFTREVHDSGNNRTVSKVGFIALPDVRQAEPFLNALAASDA